MMPQNGVNYQGRGRGMRRDTWKASSQVNGHVPGTGLVNGAVVHNGYPAAATRTSESTPAGTPNGAKPRCVLNGYINHWYRGKNTKAAPPPRMLRKREGTFSAVTDASAVGGVSGAGFPGGIAVNGATSLDAVALHCIPDQIVAKSSPSAAAKNQRRRHRFKLKKRPPRMPPQQEENWENEVHEVTVTDWEKMCFGVRPYGPEDVLHFALRDLTLKQTDTVDLPVTANYSPAIHHRRPVRWTCYNIPSEPGQFADADE